MDPLRSEICWSNFKYFIILIVSTYCILCIGWIIQRLNVIDARRKHEDSNLHIETYTVKKIILVFSESRPTKTRVLWLGVSDTLREENFLFLVKCTFRNRTKSFPLQVWSGPEGSRKLRFPDFLTTAQDGAKVVNLMHRPLLPPGNVPGTHFC